MDHAPGYPYPRFVYVILFGALMLAFGTQAFALGDLGKLRVVKFNDFAASNAHRDVSQEMAMLRDFARSMELSIEWVDVFRSREALEKLLDGSVDISISGLPIEHARDPRIRASEAIALQRFRVVGRSDITSSNPLDLAGMSLAVKLSSPLWSYLDQLRDVVGDLRLQVLPDSLSRDDTLQMVSDGIYDAALLASESGDDPLGDFPRVKYLFDLTGPEPVSWYASRANESLIFELNQFIRRYHTAYKLAHSKRRTFEDIRAQRTLRVITRLDGNNYFLKGGRPTGFELELARRFAKTNGLDLEVLVGRSDEEILEWLRTGAGDIVTTRIDARRVHGEPAFALSREYRHDATVIVTRGLKNGSLPRANQRVAGYEASTSVRALEHFGNDQFAVIRVAQSVPLTSVLDRVESGELDGMVIEARAVMDELTRRPSLSIGRSIPNEHRYRWTVRADDKRLSEAIDRFLQTAYRDETYNVLKRRYAKNTRRKADPFEKISPFDAIVQTYATKYGFDWRLITAQMYQESQFEPQAISAAGAMGLMQIMPQTAVSLGIENPVDPEASIHAGVKYLDYLRSRFESHIPVSERTWLALAAYNIGYDRVRRARDLARDSGLDADRWFDNVEVAMRTMTTAQSRLIAGHGCRCGQAIIYVREIRSLYNAYRNSRIAHAAPWARTTVPPFSALAVNDEI